MLIIVGIPDRNKMRIGKIQKQVLKVLYEEEQNKKQKLWNQRIGLKPKIIAERITKIKYPQERKDYGITPNKKWKRLIILSQARNKKTLEQALKTDPMKKMFKQIDIKRKKWHKETTAIYRAIKQLKKKWLIINNKERGSHPRYKLTKPGRRIISHRIDT